VTVPPGAPPATVAEKDQARAWTRVPLGRSLRVKTVLLALIPILLVMAIFTGIAYLSIQKTAQEVIEQRDTELARISAARLSENLKHYVSILQQIAASEEGQSMVPERLEQAIAPAKSWLHLFDGGLVVYDREGRALWSHPRMLHQLGTSFPAVRKFEELKRTFRPVFSDVFSNAAVGEDVVLIGVPLVTAGGDFQGALIGMCTVKYSLLGVMYTRVLEFKSGRSGFAYLVDGGGRVLYHRHSSLVGSHLEGEAPVRLVTRGETGAVLTRSSSGERIIAGFAPVPGTDWGVVTLENWSVVSAPIRDYLRFFWLIVWIGGAVSAALVYFFIARVLRPLQELSQGAQRIAGGDFEEIVFKPTGDELEALACQFNAMARALKASFSRLEEQVDRLNRTQAALWESRERFLLFMKHLPGRAFIEDINGRAVFANEMHQRLAAAPETPEAEGDPHPEWPRDVVERIALDDGVVYVGKIRVREETLATAGGETEWLTYKFPIFREERPELIGGIAIDITERKRAERELERHRTRLEELVQERTRDLEAAQEELIKREKLSVLGQLTATVSHELRNPLGVIRSSIYYLHRRHPQADDKTRNHLRRIEEQVEMCDAIVNELLDYARMRQPEPVFEQINPFLGKVLDDLELPAGVSLVRGFSPAVGIVPFDRNKLRRALINLMDNAINAVTARRGSATALSQNYAPEIRVSTAATASGVRVIVSDNGIGMDAGTAERAFEPLFTTRARGVGLGLAVVKKIAEEHRGTVRLESRLQEGTTVVLEISLWGRTP
jgi:signal transduction histidine kinase